MSHYQSSYSVFLQIADIADLANIVYTNCIPHGGKKMSKKTKKAPAPRKAGSGTVKSAAAVKPASRSTVGRRQSGKPEFNVNLKAVRIIAAVFGALVLFGLLFMVVQQGGEYPPSVIITVLLLAFIVGLSAFAAVRTEEFVRFFQRFSR
jgi:hypothetical protein